MWKFKDCYGCIGVVKKLAEGNLKRLLREEKRRGI